jgi:hypothetical protein
MATGKKEREEKAAQKARATVAALSPDALLPMPVRPGSTKPSRDELAEYLLTVTKKRGIRDRPAPGELARTA